MELTNTQITIAIIGAIVGFIATKILNINAGLAAFVTGVAVVLVASQTEKGKELVRKMTGKAKAGDGSE